MFERFITTEKSYIRWVIAIWVLFLTIDVAILSGGVYVVYHFICKFW